LKTIETSQLKVTPPNEFNDPFEFSPYVSGGVTSTHIQRLIGKITPKELFEQMKQDGLNVGTLDEFEKFLARAAPVLVEHGQQMFERTYDEMIAQHLDVASRSVTILCLTQEEKNILMWSHYADSHKGMLFEFDTSHEYFELHSYFRKVTYSNSRVPFDPNQPPENDSKHVEAIALTKNQVWAYENEWRSLFPLDWCHKREHDGKALFFIDIPHNIIKRIVLGYRCPRSQEDDLKKIIADKKLSISLERAVLHKTNFDLEYISIT